jgi:CheY-like chemotaxis protein
MSALDTRAPEAGEDAVITPRFRTRLRRALFWIVLAAFGLLVVAVVYSMAGSGSTGAPPLEPTSAKPDGAKAVAQVLEAEGVTVSSVTSADDALRALEGAGGATLFVVDNPYLDPSRLAGLAGASGSVVLVDPSFPVLQELAPGVRIAGSAGGDGVAADCSEATPERAERVTVDNTYRIEGDAVGCFPVDGDRFGVVSVPGSTPLTIVGSPAVFANGSVTNYGNAALALGLLGTTDELVWYVPGLADVEADAPPTIGELTPGWVVPSLLLILLATVAAGVWRGRRFGPLVVEPLPVTVRAGETMEGRARLYQRTSARLRALDSLRIGAIERIASLLALSRHADARDVSAAAAALTGRSPDEVRSILIDAVPRSDADLVGLSDALTILEAQIRTLTDPTGRTAR